jgi:hypothetical protein
MPEFSSDTPERTILGVRNSVMFLISSLNELKELLFNSLNF